VGVVVDGPAVAPFEDMIDETRFGWLWTVMALLGGVGQVDGDLNPD